MPLQAALTTTAFYAIETEKGLIMVGGGDIGAGRRTWATADNADALHGGSFRYDYEGAQFAAIEIWLVDQSPIFPRPEGHKGVAKPRMMLKLPKTSVPKIPSIVIELRLVAIMS